jgi:hypothetical protein
LDAFKDPTVINVNAKLPYTIVQGLEKASGVPFPLANNISENNAQVEMNPKKFGKAVGYLNKIAREIRPFFLIQIFNQNEDKTQKFAPFFELADPSDEMASYKDGTWNTTRPRLVQKIFDNLYHYFKATKTSVDDKLIKSEAEKLVEIDWILAQFNVKAKSLTL